MKIGSYIFVFYFILLSNRVTAFEASISVEDTISKKRLKTIIYAGSAFYATTMTGLYFAWYSKGEQTSFHFFNDNAQWKQMDKVGHFYSTFQFSRASAEAFKWVGMNEKKAAFWGMMSGIALMTPIEILDGFSSEYGASWGDLIANTAGSAFAFGQQVLWKEIRIHPKFSFHRTDFAPLRPSLLGDGLREEILKDYNGQTYWLSFDIDKFLKKENKFPKWLNIALGYSGSQMVYAQDFENQAIGLRPFRQYYLGLDIDLTAIQTKSRLVKKLIYFVNMIRLPAPALSCNSKGEWNFFAFYF